MHYGLRRLTLLKTIRARFCIPHAPVQLYGLISDMFPIFGYHRTPYLFIAGLVGTVAWVVIASLKKASFGVAAFLILLANYSIASPDVIIDAAITGKALALTKPFLCSCR